MKIMTVKNVVVFIYKRGDFEVMNLFLYKDIMMIELQNVFMHTAYNNLTPWS
jgi:hypothetical protein